MFLEEEICRSELRISVLLLDEAMAFVFQDQVIGRLRHRPDAASQGPQDSEDKLVFRLHDRTQFTIRLESTSGS